MCLTVAVFPQYSSAQQHSPIPGSLSLSLFYSSTNPPQSLPSPPAAQWAMTAITGLISVLQWQRGSAEGAEPTSAPQLSGPETWGRKLTSSQHHFIRAPNSGPGFLMANENVQESWFHTYWTESRGKTLLRPPQSNKTSSGNAVEKLPDKFKIHSGLLFISCSHLA